MDWQDEYRKKFVSPEEAVKVIKSEDTVLIPINTEPQALSTALMKRKGELKNVKIFIRSPRYDLGWIKGDFGNAFEVHLHSTAASGARALNEKEVDYIPYLTSLRFKTLDDPRREDKPIDVVMIVVSPPDKHGFCSFGLYLSHKKDCAIRAKKVLAEVSDTPAMRVRVPGDNYIHVSDIDFFVEHIPVDYQPPQSKAEQQETKIARQIAEHVSTIVRDGDTIQLGPGFITSSLPTLGAFDNRHDLGLHSPIVLPEILELIKSGVMNGKQKNVNPGKAVSGGFWFGNEEEGIDFINGNPVFEIRSMSYVNDIRVIASNDRMVAINSVLAIDLIGQFAADSIGSRMWAGAGGQVDFVIGSMLSKGGCAITVLSSTAAKGTISRIVPALEEATVVSIPYTFADYVVTEYGIARLFGKSRRQRAQELISVAHPDFRADLVKEASRLY